MAKARAINNDHDASGKKMNAHKIVSDAYDQLKKLQPTSEEIQAYADMMNDAYGIVTYSKHRGNGEYYFLRLHDTWKVKFGGRVHIDIGYVDQNLINQPNVPDTTHLMLDKDTALTFIQFIKERRKKLEELAHTNSNVRR